MNTFDELNTHVILKKINKVKQLIKDGANINSKDHFQRIPLMNAAIHGYKDIVEFLIKAGAA